MVHADREKPQPVEVISGRHFNIFFLLVVLFNDHRAHINIVSQNAPLFGGVGVLGLGCRLGGLSSFCTASTVFMLRRPLSISV